MTTRTRRAYFFRDADAGRETAIESVRGLRRQDVVQNTEVKDPGKDQPYGQSRELVGEYPGGFSYALETTTGGTTRLYRYSPNGVQNLGTTFSSSLHPEQSYVQPKGPTDTRDARTADSIRSIGDKQTAMWQRNAPRPAPLKPGTKQAI